MSNQRDQSLQDLMDVHPDWVSFLYNGLGSPHSRASNLSPVPLEFSNWRDEQRAWRKTAILFDQTHHMSEMWVTGPDAARLLSRIGVNSFEGFTSGKAKQLVGCTAEGYIIGDCILHHHGDNGYQLISGTPLLNWIHYHAINDGYKVTIEFDQATHMNPRGTRRHFRFGMDGPHAGAIFGVAVEGEAPKLPFFNTARVRIAGRDVLALRHGMAGHQGVELSGRHEDGPAVRDAVLRAGEEFGLRLGGMRAYYSSVVESGWIAYPLPGIFTGEDLRAYRQWLPAGTFEARMQIGGSYRSADIRDYYLTPFELGYGRIIKFDHDFIGREALETLQSQPHREKVTLVWNKEDVVDIYQSLLEPEMPYRYMELPVADFSFPQRDTVLSQEGRPVGTSTRCCYTANENAVLSLAMVDSEQAAPGTEVSLIWGEPDGGSNKPQVERHRQKIVRARVAPAPYAKTVQVMKRATLLPLINAG